MTFKKLSMGNCTKINSFIIAAVVCVSLALPGNADAGWIEDQFNAVQSKLNSIRSNLSTVNSRVTNVYSKVINAAGSISDGKVQNLIADVKVMLQEAVNTQQAGVTEFMGGGNCIANDGTPCGFFRTDLIEIVHTVRELNNQILAFPNIPGLNLQIQDMGFADLIDKIPPRALLPLYKVMTKTQLLDPALFDALREAGNDLAEVKTVLFPNQAPLNTFAPAALSFGCTGVNNRSTFLTITATSFNGIGMLTEVLGGVFQAFGETVIGGPVEMDAGVHGYFHGTLNTNNLGSLGELLEAISGAFSFVGSLVSDKVSSCGSEANQELLIANQDAILASMGGGTVPNPNLLANQELIIENQQSILEGQQETRCAFRKNKPKQCVRFRGNGFGGKKKPLP
jgi:outer membrane murein-binding lipoprotein Lpp